MELEIGAVQTSTWLIPDEQEFAYPAFAEEFSRSRKESKEFCYVHIRLAAARLSPRDIRRLERLGADCVSDAKPFEAYAVIENSAYALAILQADPAIVDVVVEDPPCSK